MRYDTPVYLQKKSEARLNPATGNYVTPPPRETLVHGAVSANDAQTAALYYGGLKDGTLTVHFPSHLPPFDTVRIGSKRYQADSVEELRTKTVLFLSEVH